MTGTPPRERRFSKPRQRADLLLLVAAIIVIAFAIWVILGNKGPAAPGTSAVPSAIATPTTTSDVTPPTTSTTSTATNSPALTPTAAFIGDSYTTGVGGGGTKWTTLVAKKEGWSEVNLGYRGTGYAQEFHASDCPANGCPNYLQAVAQVVAKHPDIVVVSGGRNDATNQAAAAANISQLFQQLHTKLPKAKIIAISPFWGSGSYSASLKTIGSDVQSAVQSAGGKYVDIGSPLSGPSNLVGSDGIYPTAAGYKALATAIESALRAS